MNSVQEVINKYTQELPLMERVYSEELPNPYAIAQDLGSSGVAQLFEEIAAISAERERLDKEGEVNCDELDDYWRAATRLASLIPYQIRLYPSQVIAGLTNESRSVRFYVAYCLSKTPIKEALPQLKLALSYDNDQLLTKVLKEGISACSSFGRCMREKIAKYRKIPVQWVNA